MTPETISALVNLGSAGAVIIVVGIFLKSIRERDAEWRDFFTALNANNRGEVTELAKTMERMVKALDEHDEQAKAIMREVTAIGQNVTIVKDRTTPRGKAQ